MGEKRNKQRINSKIDELPEDLHTKVDVMLADTSNSYEYISQFLKQEGYEISKSSVGRYATRSNKAMQRLLEAQAQTDRLPLDKAGRLIASLSRTKVYKDRVKQDMRKKADIAFQELEADMMKVIKQDEESVRMLKTILTKAKDRMMQDD